jgi:glutamine---fructose-6-phosphate transaminase (isomerizing)
MCGIVAMHILGGNAEKESIEALKELEYRGYDSFGVFSELRPEPKRYIGAISEADIADDLIPESKCAIAHTRWATHGVVALRNAHPHISRSGTFSVVHNGVITNHVALRKSLEANGFVFLSETDTEVVANLFEFLGGAHRPPEKLLEDVRKRLEGEYALCVMSKWWGEMIVATRQESPLIMAVRTDAIALASDESALQGFDLCAPLEDEDILKVWSDSDGVSYELYSPLTYRKLEFEPVVSKTDSCLNGKSYDSFMLKEMEEIPEAIRRAQANCTETVIDHVKRKNIVLTGCGSAYYAALYGAYVRTALNSALSYTLAFPADEIHDLHKINPGESLICISQSGETYDTLAPAKYANWGRLDVVAITNSLRSTLSKLSTLTVFQNAGVERCVLSTKSMVSQCIILQRMFDPQAASKDHDFAQLWEDTFKSLSVQTQIMEAVNVLFPVDNIFFIGRGIMMPIAYENALKVKEVTYKHAEGMGGGFFKHGTLSLIDDRFVTVAHVPSKKTSPTEYALIDANISEIEARNGVVVRVGHDGQCDITLPNTHATLNPILQLGVGQFLAYHLAVKMGRNVDRPRSLAKSVTVR